MRERWEGKGEGEERESRHSNLSAETIRFWLVCATSLFRRKLSGREKQPCVYFLICSTLLPIYFALHFYNQFSPHIIYLYLHFYDFSPHFDNFLHTVTMFSII